MQWDDARIFLAVAREGSFSSAAKRLGVQHSTVSRRIRALEQNWRRLWLNAKRPDMS